MRADTLDQHPATIKAADAKTTLRRFTMAGVLYALNRDDARRRFEELELHGWTHAEITDGYDHETAAEERAEALRELVDALRGNFPSAERGKDAAGPSAFVNPRTLAALARADEVLEGVAPPEAGRMAASDGIGA